MAQNATQIIFKKSGAPKIYKSVRPNCAPIHGGMKKKKMPRKSKVAEPSESASEEYSSLSGSESASEEEPVAPPPKKSRSSKSAVVTPPEPAAPVKRSKKEKTPAPEPESSEEEDDDVDKLKAGAQKAFDECYAKAAKRSSGKKASGLPQGTGLYIKQRSDITGKTQWVMAVAGKGNYASDKALEAARTYLDTAGFRSSLRVAITGATN